MSSTGSRIRRFKKETGLKSPVSQVVTTLPQKILGRILGLHHFDKLYYKLLLQEEDAPFLNKLLREIGADHTVPDGDLALIPRKGPLIVVSNHPYGGLDGLVLLKILSSVRSDIKAMANYMLGQVAELADRFILVDPFENRASIAANIGPLREAIQWLRQENALIIFPAGEVSHITWQNWKVTDPAWGMTVARIVRKTEATVVPAYFDGANSTLFQVAGLIHPLLRTALLPRELLKQAGRKIDVRIGTPIPFDTLKKFQRSEDMVEYLRWRTYMLRNLPHEPAATTAVAGFEAKAAPARFQPIVAPVDVELLEEDLTALPPECLLVSEDEFDVYQAESHQIPNVIREIGRLREVAFREVGEGTGKPIDIDRFDDYYIQLFLWDKKERKIVGAYRIGQTDVILEQKTPDDLYTSTLFEYKQEFINHVTPGLEMGRSFVCPEYQRSFKPLMLLWKGIGEFACRQPRYKILFGPVSITRDYLPVSRHLISAFFEKFIPEIRLADYVSPRNPLADKPAEEWKLDAALSRLRDYSELSSAISELESDNKGIPILLKHYLKLGGQVLAFNVDDQFSDVLDGMIVVDLTRTDRRKLERYMGRQKAEAFLAHHRDRSATEKAG